MKKFLKLEKNNSRVIYNKYCCPVGKTRPTLEQVEDYFKQAKQTVTRAMAYATRDRLQRKRKMRELWIIRINAAARLSGLSYSKFMAGLKAANIELDRKVLADLAVENAAEFAKLVEVAKANLK